MSQEEAFDSFYRATRSDVLLQAFLLTGDLTAATSAVKDAYAVTWQHWKKVSTREAAGEPGIHYVRPLAWRLAQRRHTGRIWHRNKGLDDSQREVLDALHKVPAGRRRVLLLVDVAGVDEAAAARELGLTATAAHERLDRARSELTAVLGQEYAERLRTLSVPADAARLPRPSIVLRAGRQRRRVQTVGAVVGVVALTVGVGAVAHEPGRDRAAAAHHVLPPDGPARDQLPPGVELTAAEQLLEAYQLSDLAPEQSWDVVRTDDNTGGDGINTICQQTRFADPRGLAALVRTYQASGRPTRTALQSVELSRDTEAAERTYDRAVHWFAACQEARLQLLDAYDVTGVGDQARLLRMQVAGDPAQTYDVAIARSGPMTTALVMDTTGDDSPRPGVLATALGDAVENLCPTDDLDGCVHDPRAVRSAPPSSGEEPGFVATVDLPPVERIRQPWVGVP
jgi:DNA-directed RNA polymerase specialized sigma24 family protein